MTVRLAIDEVPGFSVPSVGLIVGMNPTAQGLIDAGFTASKGYTGNRVVTIDDTDDSLFDPNTEIGWYLSGGATQVEVPLTNAQFVAQHIRDFQAAVEREAIDWERVVAEENFSPHTDSGHAWSDDLLHSLIIPNIRLQFTRLETAKGSPTPANIEDYEDGEQNLARFIAAANYGVLNIYHNADKSVWRPLRSGAVAYGYNLADGGIRQTGNPPANVETAVTYPTGTTVATWDALQAVRSL